MGKYAYSNRDLSWLKFNYRVLEEAKDQSNPLFERIKFLAIYSNNLEEFYQVRVSYYRQLLKNADKFPKKVASVNPDGVLKQINEIVSKYQFEFHQIFDNEIVPELKMNNIILLDKHSVLSEEQKLNIKETFTSDILSLLQPVLLIKKRIRPFLKTGQVYIVMQMINKEAKDDVNARTRYGLIKLPTDHRIPRFIKIDSQDEKHYIMFLEDIIMHHANKIFTGFIVTDWYSIKLTRDADLEFDDYEEEEDLIDAIENSAKSRTLGKPNRFLYDRDMPENFLEYLMQTFKVKNEITVKGGTYHNFRDFFSFPNPLSPALENETLPPLPMPELDGYKKLSDAIDKKDFIQTVPYQSYDYFLSFLYQASKDESVIEIKTTQYRVAERSSVVSALMKAAENGKKVTVFVELKARFDEEANLRYAEEMTKAGINIVYSIQGLKVHAKVALIIRDKENYPKAKDQTYLSTGNFNEKTARLYTDHGLFTSNVEIIDDLKNMFKYLENREQQIRFKHLLVPGFNLISNFGKLINNEIQQVKAGKKGYILLKMNGLQDPKMVDMLYRASEEGVKIDLIVRGICILKTGQPFSENIRVIRIIDRFLEHPRVFVFNNNGDPRVYMGSADWMKRNLYKRVECVFPVYDNDLKQEVIDVLNIQLCDNVKACEIGPNMENIRIENDKPKVQSQLATYEYFKKKYFG